jgi:DNA mismatch repair protein MutH
MTIGKKDLEKREREWKGVLKELEAKCSGGSGSKADYEALTKLKKKFK